MKLSLTKSHVALATVAAASFALASGCCSSRRGTGTAYYSEQPRGYGGTASTTEYSTSQSTTMNQPSEINVSGQTNTVIPLYKESLAVGKRDVDAGSVRVKKIVKTETVNQPIELRHEEVEIQRIPPSSSETASAPSGTAFQQQETVIHLTKEEPVVEKQITSAGQVVLKARTESTQANVQRDVRSEDVAVVKSGNAGQNVTIGQGIQQSGEAMGAAETPAGQAAGQASSSGTISDPTMLSTGATGDLAGRTAQFSDLKVKSVMGDHIAVLDAGNGQSLYVYSAQGGNNLKAGETVNVKGTVKTSASDLSGNEAQVLSSQSAFIDAQKIEPAGQ